MKFRDHKYTWESPFNSTRHQWCFRGPDGGIQFHVSIMDNPSNELFREPSCGLEFHHNTQPHGEPRAADHSPCWLTGQPCWHDGTSLYASETVWPHIEPMLLSGDHVAIFHYLERLYEEHFEAYDEDIEERTSQ